MNVYLVSPTTFCSLAWCIFCLCKLSQSLTPASEFIHWIWVLNWNCHVKLQLALKCTILWLKWTFNWLKMTHNWTEEKSWNGKNFDTSLPDSIFLLEKIANTWLEFMCRDPETQQYRGEIQCKSWATTFSKLGTTEETRLIPSFCAINA